MNPAAKEEIAQMIRDEINSTLENTFDVYRKIHALEDKHIRTVLYETMKQVADTLKPLNK